MVLALTPSFFEWNKVPAAYEAARAKIAALITSSPAR
jgi:hypothetical protein